MTTEPLLTLDERIELNQFWIDAGCPKLSGTTIEERRAEIADLIVAARETAYRNLASAVIDYAVAGKGDPSKLTEELVASRRLRRAARLTLAVAHRDADNAKGTQR